MSDVNDRDRDAEGFLRRWSRLKEQAKDATPVAPAAPQPADEAPPELPPVETLDLQSDYRGFFHPKVKETLRRAALKKLFSDPHFNVMDGLDVYIEDYTKSEILPATMLGELRQAQNILRWARDGQTSTPGTETGDMPAPSSAQDALPQAGDAPEAGVPAHAPNIDVTQPDDKAAPHPNEDAVS